MADAENKGDGTGTGTETKAKIRKLDLSKPEDVDFLIDEIKMIDQTGILITTLQLCIIAHGNDHPEHYRLGDTSPIPIPPMFIQTLRDALHRHETTTIPSLKNLIMLLEEGL